MQEWPPLDIDISEIKLNFSILSMIVNYCTWYHILTLTISEDEYQVNYLGQKISNNPFYLFIQRWLKQLKRQSDSPKKLNQPIFKKMAAFSDNLNKFPKLDETLIAQAIETYPINAVFSSWKYRPVSKYSTYDVEAILKIVQKTTKMIMQFCPLKNIKFGHKEINEEGKALKLKADARLIFYGENAIFRLRMSKEGWDKNFCLQDFFQMMLYCLYIKDIPHCNELAFIDPINGMSYSIDINQLGEKDYLRWEIQRRYLELSEDNSLN